MASSEEFDPVATARDLLRTSLVGSLATLDDQGGPFVSLVDIASDPTRLVRKRLRAVATGSNSSLGITVRLLYRRPCQVDRISFEGAIG